MPFAQKIWRERWWKKVVIYLVVKKNSGLEKCGSISQCISRRKIWHSARRTGDLLDYLPEPRSGFQSRLGNCISKYQKRLSGSGAVFKFWKFCRHEKSVLRTLEMINTYYTTIIKHHHLYKHATRDDDA